MAVDVVAALVVENGKFMICQRPQNKARGLLWEFVGGKVEPGETRAEALVRECREELGVTVAPGEIYMEVDHVYPDITIHLTLFRAAIVSGRPQKLEHADIRFIAPSDIPLYAFCPADASILAQITDRGFA
jgi:8-oxo-dGTP diphosphatase